jgi:hypothetical protein
MKFLRNYGWRSLYVLLITICCIYLILIAGKYFDRKALLGKVGVDTMRINVLPNATVNFNKTKWKYGKTYFTGDVEKTSIVKKSAKQKKENKSQFPQLSRIAESENADIAEGIILNGSSSVPALIDTTGKLLVTIDAYADNALLSCDSIRHEWVDGPDIVVTLKPYEWHNVDGRVKANKPIIFQHCKICGTLRIKLENEVNEGNREKEEK